MPITRDTILGDKYRLVRQLDEGAMGSVWLAEHVSLRSPVAIKLIAREIAETEDGLQRFFREARTAAALRTPHVVQILDYGVQQGIPYIVMELLEGEALSDRLERLGRLSPAETEHVLRHVSRALSRAHEAGIVHRDLKPANVFIVISEEEELCKLLDFGIAKARVDVLTASMASNTRTGVFLGTPFYMSPEQVEGSKDLDYRADIWSLGVLAYECLLGSLPFSGDTFGSLVLSICSRPLPIPSERGPVPAGFDAWFARACARDPAQRFSSAREAASELRRLTEAALGSSERPQAAHSPYEARLAQMATAPAFPPPAAHPPGAPAAPGAPGDAVHRTPAPVLTETNGGAAKAAPHGSGGMRSNQRALIGGVVLAVALLFVTLLPRARDAGSRAAAGKAAPPAVTTGIQVAAAGGEGAPLSLFVDGTRVGALPLEPIALEPGEHRVVISGGPRFLDREERVVVERGRVTRVGPVALRPKPALAPYPGSQPPKQPHPGPQAATAASARTASSSGARDAALATLTVESAPTSRVLLDGKLLGVTPIVDLSIEPGTHQVVLIHGVETRVKTVTVEAGKAGRVDVKF